MNLFEVTKLITAGKAVLDWIDTRSEKESKVISLYISQIQRACQELIELEDPKSDKAFLLHEQLKVIYDNASSKLPSSLIHDNRGLILYNALSSARIYYWIRVIESVTDNYELEALIGHRVRLPRSLDTLTNMVSKAYWTSDKIDVRDIAMIRQACLRDIAQLSRLLP